MSDGAAGALSASDLGRLETLADGVFAIAITLLVIEIKLPEAAEIASAGGLMASLAARWPSYLAFLLSFALIGSFWVNHHAMFRLLTGTNHIFTLLTLLLLLTIAFLPFPTAVFGHHMLDPAYANRRDAVTVYSGGLLATALAWTMGWLYAAGRLTDPRLDPVFLLSLSRRYGRSVLLHFVALVLAWYAPTLGLLAATFMALLYLGRPPEPILQAEVPTSPNDRVTLVPHQGEIDYAAWTNHMPLG